MIEEVESSGTARIMDIRHTAVVKAGDRITAIGSSHEGLEYLALPGTEVHDAATIVEKVHKAEGNVRLQLERPLEQVHKYSYPFFPQALEWTFFCSILR